MMGDGFGFAMGYGSSWIFWILCLVLIIWLYSVIINRHDTPNDKKILSNRKTPVEILEQRFAEGKIDEDEFNKRLAHLHRDVMP
ncbi:MAG: SHOCT domain-containing protein [Gammaproteobacteria bacterium]|nr:MAG: SHOCT domain-containing protein [Gammaproteobacteria bacterium]